jgi:hypothetical protein
VRRLAPETPHPPGLSRKLSRGPRVGRCPAGELLGPDPKPRVQVSWLVEPGAALARPVVLCGEGDKEGDLQKIGLEPDSQAMPLRERKSCKFFAVSLLFLVVVIAVAQGGA